MKNWTSLLAEEWLLRDDYQKMRTGFIYANAPSFDEIVGQMRLLQDRFRLLQWDI